MKQKNKRLRIERTIDKWIEVTTSNNVRDEDFCREILKEMAEVPFDLLVNESGAKRGWKGLISDKLLGMKTEEGRDSVDLYNVYSGFFASTVNNARQANRR